MNKFIVPLLALSLFSSCKNHQLSEQEQELVKTVSAECISSSSEHRYSFIAQPYHTSELSFRIGGPIKKLDVQTGQFFHKGQVIAEIDKRDYVIKNKRAKANFDRAEADFKRISKLFKKGNISESSYEKAKADYEQAKANLSETQNNLSDTKLLAPFDGYVQAVHAEPYQDIKPTMPVITFIELNKIKIETYIPEEVAINFRNDGRTPVEISFNMYQSEKFTPLETFVSQSTSDNNISYCLTAIINNENNLLRGGMTGSLTIKSTMNEPAQKVIVIPLSALCNDPNKGSYVWKIQEDNTVKQCPIKIGQIRKDNKIEIVKGLDEGETVAISCLQHLYEGKQIHL